MTAVVSPKVDRLRSIAFFLESVVEGYVGIYIEPKGLKITKRENYYHKLVELLEVCNTSLEKSESITDITEKDSYLEDTYKDLVSTLEAYSKETAIGITVQFLKNLKELKILFKSNYKEFTSEVNEKINELSEETEQSPVNALIFDGRSYLDVLIHIQELIKESNLESIYNLLSNATEDVLKFEYFTKSMIQVVLFSKGI